MAKHYIIDIGHANGTGARSLEADPKYRDEEHDLCTKIGAELHKLLNKCGSTATIIDFPTMNNSQDLNATITEANKIKADLGISIHMDAASTETPRGAHVCYYSTTGKKYAEKIAPRLTQLLPGRASSVVLRTDLAVLKKTKWPWVLIECGFITNPHDRAIAKDHPEWIAEAIANSLAAE